MEGFSVRLFQVARSFVGVEYSALTPEEKQIVQSVYSYLWNVEPGSEGIIDFNQGLIEILCEGCDNGTLSKEVQDGVFDYLYEMAWADGHAARMDKQPLLSCPFSDESRFVEAWGDGWSDADMEERRKNHNKNVTVGCRVVSVLSEDNEEQGIVAGIELSDRPFRVQWDDGKVTYAKGESIRFVEES